MASALKVQEREVVVPGEILAEGMEYLPSYGTYRLGDAIRAAQLGLVRVDGKVIKLIPLAGRYVPKRDDVVIGKVVNILMSGWMLDINCAYSAVLSVKEATSRFIEKGADLTRILALGDYAVTRIVNVTTQKLVDVSMRAPGLWKLAGGRDFSVNTHKVPRIIGKQGSMVKMIKDATGCKITVGQNGLVWIDGDPEMENIAVEAIRLIEDQSHIQGLTERVHAFLKNKTKKDIVIPKMQ
ncbi:RNA-binding protein [Candidatus Woesearchaeota archaeon]|nr:RNA-binding protein [Candidatus Woesearchaeota archaeon]